MSIDSKKTHVIVLIAGFAFLVAGAFHGNLWFDETYSVAIARYSFADIWDIGACDVHPVLYYLALHVLYLVFGTNLVAYRLFTVLGAWSLALLGYTHVRHDFGAREGLLFTFIALFTPYVAIMAVQIRMYSWATFTVTLCLLTALRIMWGMRDAKASRPDGADGDLGQRDEGTRLSPARQWVVFAVSSLASAYLHYFGAISAAIINLILFAYLLVNARRRRRDLGVFVLQAVLQLLCYVPWLFALSSQLGVVGNTYWAQLRVPLSYIEHATYLVKTSCITFALTGEAGSAVQMLLTVLVWALPLLLIAAVAIVVARYIIGLMNHGNRRGLPEEGKSHGVPSLPRNAQACLLGLVVYAGVYAVGMVAGHVMDSYIMYYRYLFVPFGALALSVALILGAVRPQWVAACACAVLLAISLINQGLHLAGDYSPENGKTADYLEQVYRELKGEGGLEDGQVLVLSSDIGIEGVTALECPDIPQVYMDWQPGHWDGAYRCYEPTLTSVRSWEEALDGYRGYFIVLGQSETNTTPRDISDLSQKDGISLVSEQMFYRPYERTYFDVAVMYKVDSCDASSQA